MRAFAFRKLGDRRYSLACSGLGEWIELRNESSLAMKVEGTIDLFFQRQRRTDPRTGDPPVPAANQIPMG